MTDPIADMLTRLRNASAVRKSEVLMPYSRTKFAIAKILEKEGFVQKIEEQEKPHQIKIMMKYVERNPALQSVRRISKPGCRIYRGYDELSRVRNGLGMAILSTSSGLMTDREARKQKVGGEVLCEIY